LTDTTGVVLVVDDNAANIAVYQKIIGEVRGVVSKCFTDSNEALAFLLNERPILAIVDYRMPDIDGLSFITRMRSITGRSSIPVIMLTGSDDEKIRARALVLGVHDFMKKPIDKRRLQAFITHALRTRLAEPPEISP
jgi:CheY-like chemotaxis protein